MFSHRFVCCFQWARYVSFQRNNKRHFWIDGSPYAFQLWEEPRVSTLDKNTYILYKYDGQWRRKFEFERQKACLHCVGYIEPQSQPDYPCTAAINTADGIIKWKKIPCSKRTQATIICEIKSSYYQAEGTEQNKAYLRRYNECPPRTIFLKEICIGIYTTTWTTFDGINNICISRRGSLYHIPDFILSKDPFLYDKGEIFIISFLQSMSQRWPGLADYGRVIKDKLIMLSDNGSAAVAFQYSSTTFSHVETADLAIAPADGSLHVVCRFPLLPSDSSCLRGHFTCFDGTCILEHYACDGFIDCPEGSDEIKCDFTCTFTPNTTEKQDCFSSCALSTCVCSDLYFQCSLGGCVPWSRVCDGVNDCPKSEDEHVCQFYYLDTSKEIPLIQSGDTLHFPDAASSPLEEFQCLFNMNVSLILVNDLVPDCPYQADDCLSRVSNQ